MVPDTHKIYQSKASFPCDRLKVEGCDAIFRRDKSQIWVG